MRTALMAAGAGLGLLTSLIMAGPATAEPRTQYYYAAAWVTVDAARTESPKCPGGRQQYFHATDANGVPIAYTYANNDYSCVTVSFSPRYLNRECDFSFYVPNGHATAKVRLWFETDDRDVFEVIDENPVDGWQYVRSERQVKRIFFTDANGYKTGKLGWGMDAKHGIKQVCRV
ncbi:hypothetical protein OIE66_14560 [Nonomuraea sp. NBC_01738]|uniref:hypothetical protein n=1 Tax=Nonomuraea sp. NBC_01738 TaxID=2976003 RepID=UPI002E0EF626|nr:hypothetical protein OIE66_14560 [Nonomuraea sp. NBC_01738]